MIVLIPYINLLNLSWMVKCLFLRNMEPLSKSIWLSVDITNNCWNLSDSKDPDHVS